MAPEEAKSDRHIDLFGVRSLLFLPASNPRAIAKARDAGADLVVLDLEDAVKPADKDAARSAAVAAVAEQWPMPVAVRINGSASEWQSRDLDAVAKSNADLIVVPRTSTAAEVQEVAARVGRPVLAMIETAAGVLASAEIARMGAALRPGPRLRPGRPNPPPKPNCADASGMEGTMKAATASAMRAGRNGDRLRSWKFAGRSGKRGRSAERTAATSRTSSASSF